MRESQAAESGVQLCNVQKIATYLGHPRGTGKSQVPRNNRVKRKLAGEWGKCPVGWCWLWGPEEERPGLCFPEPAERCCDPCTLLGWGCSQTLNWNENILLRVFQVQNPVGSLEEKGYYLMTDSSGQCLAVTHRISICWKFQGGVFQKPCIPALDFWFRETMGCPEQRVCVCLWSWTFISSHSMTGTVKPYPHSSKAWEFLRKLSPGIWCLPFFNSLCKYLCRVCSGPAICAKELERKDTKDRVPPLGLLQI